MNQMKIIIKQKEEEEEEDGQHSFRAAPPVPVYVSKQSKRTPTQQIQESDIFWNMIMLSLGCRCDNNFLSRLSSSE